MARFLYIHCSEWSVLLLENRADPTHPESVNLMRISSVQRLLAALLFAFAMTLAAQDSRTVTEPHIPAACTTLKAAIATSPGASAGVIAQRDESKLDTARIQAALDSCAAGKAVVLQSEGKKTVFLSGPLTLRSLYAS